VRVAVSILHYITTPVGPGHSDGMASFQRRVRRAHHSDDEYDKRVAVSIFYYRIRIAGRADDKLLVIPKYFLRNCNYYKRVVVIAAIANSVLLIASNN